MPGPSEADKKVYEALRRPEFFPDEFKTWLPRFLRYLSALQVTKAQLPGVMGENWINVSPFVTPWRHYQTGTTVFGFVRYYKDYQGIVHLDGLAETTGTPAANSAIFNLPPGYRPVQTTMVIAYAAPAAVNTPGRIDIGATGDVSPVTPAATAFTNGSWCSLANIHFRAA